MNDIRVDSGDLVATAGAGVTLAALDDALAAHHAWLAIDPPGSRARTLGDALASGSPGPLAAGFGYPRDQVLGLTFTAGTGQQVKTGGRVVKNVAGFDLAKLLIGSFGALGTIREAHLRLRVRPEADVSAAIPGTLPALARRTAALMAGGASPVAFEVVSPALAAAMGCGDGWTLLLRAMGSGIAAREEIAACGAEPREIAWPRWHEAVGGWPVLLRIGADPSAWPEAVAMAGEHLGSPLGVSVCVPRGTVRVGLTHGDAEALRALRAVTALRGWPVTLERAGATTLAAVGIWGAMNGGAMMLTRRLLEVYDPRGTLQVPLFAS